MTQMQTAVAMAPTWDIEDRNRALVSELFSQLAKAPAERDPDLMDALYVEGFEGKGPARDNCGHHSPGGARDMFRAFSDTTFDIKKTVASGERVISYVSFSGVHTDWFDGHAPTGRRMSADGVVVHRVIDGRIVEQWSVLRWQ
ncbi:MAG: ester cyclase [Dehalococcoidia bacterium]